MSRRTTMDTNGKTSAFTLAALLCIVREATVKVAELPQEDKERLDTTVFNSVMKEVGA